MASRFDLQYLRHHEHRSQLGWLMLRLTVAGKEYLAQVQAALALLAAVPLHRRAPQPLIAWSRKNTAMATPAAIRVPV